MEPCEVDLPDAIAAGTVVGVKQAALRKLQQELGCTFLQVSDFHFLTRLHYWAADTVTHGAAAPWGEHEIDYVLFAACNKTELALHPNPDEVSNTKWVSPQELQSMMRDPSLLFSPWFRLICQTWLLTTWWKDLDGAMAGTYDDFVSIHTFDPPPEHFGGAGHAQPLFANSENNVVDVGGDARYVGMI
jgi:isopentenyl-diphosphate delta-isomerase type 1